MKKFLIKLTVFSFPVLAFIFIMAYRILVLPIDKDTFRVWEAFWVYERTPILSGPFYPGMYITKTELGDLPPDRDKWGVPKQVEWYTDRYGFRKKETGRDKYDIVIIGDSLTAGSSLTQNDLLSEKLEKRLGVSVYPFAPYTDINEYLSEERFQENPPDLIIVESAQKLALSLPEIIPDDQREVKEVDFWTFLSERVRVSDTFIVKIAILNDRLKKNAFINYLYSRLTKLPKKIFDASLAKLLETTELGKRKSLVDKVEYGRPDVNGINRMGMIFYPYPEIDFIDWNDFEIIRVAKTLKSYQDRLSQYGTELIYMPVPNKENIYWDLLEGGRKMDNLPKLIEAVRAEGVLTVDLNSVYNTMYKNDPNKLIYHIDDSHWTPYAVDMAVDQLMPYLGQLGY